MTIDDPPMRPQGAVGSQAREISAETFALVARGKQEWERTLDAIGDPIALQHGYAIRRANRTLAVQGNVTVREVAGKTCHELLAGRSTPCPGCPLGGALRDPVIGEVQFPEHRTVQVSCFPARGTLDGEWVVHHHDVTAERAAVVALREQERLAAVSRLAAGAAHEINNPLTYLITNLSILGDSVQRLEVLASSLRRALDLASNGAAQAGLEVLERFRGSPHLTALETLGAEGPELITEALQGARRVADIVSALGRLTAERQGEPGQLDLSESVERALQALYEDAPALRDRATEWGIRQRLPVLGIMKDIDDAVLEVLRNAFQHGASNQPVRISASTAGEEAVLRIVDSGPGMDEQIRSRVFEPFFTTSEPGAGTGLGLTVAHAIIRQHGGQILVHSSPGKGTLIEIRLPMVQVEL